MSVVKELTKEEAAKIYYQAFAKEWERMTGNRYYGKDMAISLAVPSWRSLTPTEIRRHGEDDACAVVKALERAC